VVTGMATAATKTGIHESSRDLGHRFDAEDFADSEGFHGGGAAVIFRAH
jgi:hypothetical protein